MKTNDEPESLTFILLLNMKITKLITSTLSVKMSLLFTLKPFKIHGKLIVYLKCYINANTAGEARFLDHL